MRDQMDQDRRTAFVVTQLLVAGGLLGAAALRRRPTSQPSAATPERAQSTANPL